MSDLRDDLPQERTAPLGEYRHRSVTATVLQRVAAALDGDCSVEPGTADVQHLVHFARYLWGWLEYDGNQPRYYQTLEALFDELRREGRL